MPRRAPIRRVHPLAATPFHSGPPTPLARSAQALRLALFGSAALAAAACSLPAHAQASTGTPAAVEAPRRYDIPAGPLDAVLARYAGESGVLLAGASELVQGRRSPGLQGAHTPQSALATLLAGTGLEAPKQADGSYVLRPVAAPREGAAGERVLPAVTVTARAERPGDLPPLQAGGQVARGGRAGMLGNKDAMDLPFNVTSYTRELIEDRQAATVSDLLDNDPAVRTASRGRNTTVGGGDNFTVRGFALTNRDISLDGLYGVLPYGSLSLETVERVEVLKGPAALLSGMAPSGGVGGVINVTPKRARDEPLTRFTASYASDAQWGGHLDLGRRFGSEQELGVRVNGVYREGDTAIGGQSAKLAAGSVGLDYRGRQVRLSMDAGRQLDKVDAASTGYDFDSSVTVVPAAPRAGAQFTQDWEERYFKDSYAALHGEVDVTDDVMLYGAAGVRRHAHTNFRTISTVLDSAGNLATTPVSYPESSTSRTWLVGGRVRFEALAARHELNVAASSQQYDASFAYNWWDTVDSNLYRGTVIPRPTPVTASESGFFDLRKAYDRRISSVGVADTLSWQRDTVQLTLGLRRQRVVQDNFDPWTAGAPQVGTDDTSTNSPAVALVVQPWKGVSLYANYIEGLSPGASAPADAENAGQVFPPVKTKQVELGAKLDFGGLLGTLAVFELRQPNAITLPGPTTYFYVMDGEQRNRGVELGAVGELAAGLRFIGGATWVRAQQVRTQDGARDGKDALAVPRWIGNAGLDWDTPWLPGLALNTRVLLTGAQYLNADNTLALPGWARWDLGARYKTRVAERPLTLRLQVLNVADRNYWESSGGSAGILLGAPRTLNLSATVDF